MKEDNFTRTVDGARAHAERLAREEEWMYREWVDDDAEEEDEDTEDECNCSDPGCPCGGRKRGTL